MDVERTMEFLLEEHARFMSEMAELKAVTAEHSKQIATLFRSTDMLSRNQAAFIESLRLMAEQQQRAAQEWRQSQAEQNQEWRQSEAEQNREWQQSEAEQNQAWRQAHAEQEREWAQVRAEQAREWEQAMAARAEEWRQAMTEQDRRLGERLDQLARTMADFLGRNGGQRT